MPSNPNSRGLAAMILAYALWGLVPIYWRTLNRVDPLELLLIRLILTSLTCLALLPMRGSWDTFRESFRDISSLKLHLLAAGLLAANWFCFIWTVSTGRILESSLGYFLCPLVSIVLGRFIEKERLGPMRWLAVLFAAAGVAILVVQAGRIPVAALVIAVSWSSYALIKKRDKLGPMVSLGLETTLVAPFAAIFLLGLFFHHPLTAQAADPVTLGFLFLSGAVTAFPLLLFAYGAKYLRLTTMGMGQYMVPSAHFFLAVYYGEPVDLKVIMAFALIWIGLGLYSFAALQNRHVVESV